MVLKYLQELKKMENEFASSQRKAFLTTDTEYDVGLSLMFFDTFENLYRQDSDFDITRPIINKDKLGTALLEICSMIEEINNVIYKYINLCNKLDIPNSDLLIEAKIIYPLFRELGAKCIYFDIFKRLEHEKFQKELKLFKNKKNEILNFDTNIFKNMQEDKEATNIVNDIIEASDIFVKFIKDMTIKDFTIDYLKTYILELKELIELINVYIINDENSIYTKLSKTKRIFLFEVLETPSNSFIYPFSKVETKINIDNDYLNIWNFKERYLYKNLSKNKENNKKLLLDYIENNDIELFTTYRVNSIQELLNISFMEIFKKGITICKCKNCGKYFIPENRTDEVYCNRISPQNPSKTCKEYGAKKTYREGLKSRPISNEHNRTSQFYRMKIKRCSNEKEKEKLAVRFDKYKTEFKEKKKEYDNKKVTEIDFVKWIKSQKNII